MLSLNTEVTYNTLLDHRANTLFWLGLVVHNKEMNYVYVERRRFRHDFQQMRSLINDKTSVQIEHAQTKVVIKRQNEACSFEMSGNC